MAQRITDVTLIVDVYEAVDGEHTFVFKPEPSHPAVLQLWQEYRAQVLAMKNDPNQDPFIL